MSRFAAAVVAVSFGAAPHVWLFHTQPEVFALNHLAAAAIVAAAAPEGFARGTRRVAVLGVLAGLALSNHHTAILLAPLGLYGVYLGVREAESLLRPLGVGVLALAAGLLPYLYLPWVASLGEGWHWGDASTIDGFLDVFLRRSYGMFRMTAGETPNLPWTQIRFLAAESTRDLRFVPMLGALAGAVGAAGLGSPVESDREIWAWRWLLVSTLLAGPLFVTQLTRQPEGIDFLLVRRFHLMPQLLLALLAGLAAHWLEPLLDRRASRIAVVAALGAASIPGIASSLQHHHAPTVEQYVEETLEPLPEESVVMGTGDHRFFGALYFQRALERRPDLEYVDATLLALDWYQTRATKRLDLDLPYRGEDVPLDSWFEAVLETDRPLFVTHPFHRPTLQKWPTSPWGTTIRVYPSRRDRPPPTVVFRGNLELLETSRIAPRPGASPNSWASFVLNDYADRWEATASALAGTSNPDLAERARRIEERLRPKSKSAPASR